MCRIVLIIVVVVLVLLMVGAALVVQEYGWPGFLVFVAALMVTVYLARKAMPRVFVHMLTRPLRRMGAALRGARILVHSVTPCEPPPREEYDPEPDRDDPDYDDEEAIEDRDDLKDDAGDEAGGLRDEDETTSPTVPLDWYWIEFTVTPADAGWSEGRIVHRRGWMPQLVGVVGPRAELARANPFRGWPLAMQFTDAVQYTPAQVWDGVEFAESGMDVFGEQRLRMRVGVARDVRAVTISYAQYTDLGQAQIPRIDVSPEPKP
jgi:hypothetical protein